MQFSNLEAVTEELLEHFARWLEDTDGPVEYLGQDGLLKLQLVVHEWVANLVEHAVFNGRPPEIRIEIEPADPQGVWCRIYDNSEGFDWDRHASDTVPLDDWEAERGRGLAFIQALCKQTFYQSREGLNCLSVWVVER